MATYRVTAPYVLLKTLDQASGKAVIVGYYAGAVVSDEQVDKDSLKRHMAKKMIERIAAPKAAPKTSDKDSGGKEQGAGEGTPAAPDESGGSTSDASAAKSDKPPAGGKS